MEMQPWAGAMIVSGAAPQPASEHTAPVAHGGLQPRSADPPSVMVPLAAPDSPLPLVLLPLVAPVVPVEPSPLAAPAPADEPEGSPDVCPDPVLAPETFPAELPLP
jgi:hypothetical protein